MGTPSLCPPWVWKKEYSTSHTDCWSNITPLTPYCLSHVLTGINVVDRIVNNYRALKGQQIQVINQIWAQAVNKKNHLTPECLWQEKDHEKQNPSPEQWTGNTKEDREHRLQNQSVRKGYIGYIVAVLVSGMCGTAKAAWEYKDSWNIFPYQVVTPTVEVPAGEEKAGELNYGCYGGKFADNDSLNISRGYCIDAIDWTVGRGEWFKKKQTIACTATTAGLNQNVPFNENDLTIGPWTLKPVSTDSRRFTSNNLQDMGYMNRSEFIVVYFLASYSVTPGETALKPLTVTCTMDNGVWVNETGSPGNKTLAMTFKPKISAEFSAKVTKTDQTHRTKVAGEHEITMDFGKTVWDTGTRSLTYKVDTTQAACLAAKTTITGTYDNGTAKAFNPGTNLNLKTDTATEAKLKLKVKRSEAGSYSCNVTITQTVT